MSEDRSETIDGLCVKSKKYRTGPGWRCWVELLTNDDGLYDDSPAAVKASWEFVDARRREGYMMALEKIRTLAKDSAGVDASVGAGLALLEQILAKEAPVEPTTS